MAAELKQVEETAIAKASQESITFYESAKTLIVKDQETYNMAVEGYKAGLTAEKYVHSIHDPVCNHFNKLWKGACDIRNRDLEKVEEGKRIYKSKAAAYQDEQERIRREAERKAQEEARRIAEEQARIAREAAEAERKRLAAIEEEERLRLAAEAEASGATQEQVTEILDAPMPIPEPEVFIPEPVIVPTVAPTYEKAAGFAVRWKYSAKFVDLTALIKAAAVNPYLAGYLQFNEGAINAMARAQKDAFKLPGCELRKERV